MRTTAAILYDVVDRTHRVGQPALGSGSDGTAGDSGGRVIPTVPLGSIEDFLVEVSSRLGIPASELHAEMKLMTDLELSSLDLFRLDLLMDRHLPGFHLPDQLDLSDTRLTDVYYYLAIRLEQLA